MLLRVYRQLWIDGIGRVGLCILSTQRLQDAELELVRSYQVQMSSEWTMMLSQRACAYEARELLPTSYEDFSSILTVDSRQPMIPLQDTFFPFAHRSRPRPVWYDSNGVRICLEMIQVAGHRCSHSCVLTLATTPLFRYGILPVRIDNKEKNTDTITH